MGNKAKGLGIFDLLGTLDEDGFQGQDDVVLGIFLAELEGDGGFYYWRL